MYPQQQYQISPFNFQQQQQPYYSSSLHPPGTDPVANSAPFSAPVSVYASQTTDYQNWIVPQSEHIAYDPVSISYPFDLTFQFCYQNLIFIMLCHLGCFQFYFILFLLFCFVDLLKLLLHFIVAVRIKNLFFNY
jgi:hypothetical protein